LEISLRRFVQHDPSGLLREGEQVAHGCTPHIAFNTAEGRKRLREKIRGWGLRLGRIVIKEFPSGSLTLAQLSSYLDYVQTVAEHRDVQFAKIRVPTLILHSLHDGAVNFGASRYMADRIPQAKLVELPGVDHLVGSATRTRS
jgi:pimeloyl-ACP methyl ester carboxylesterase